ncbi:ABC transporter G family member 23 isoform X2 [Halyomorpha halys]|uniref:ABC transporter G family member 23 isoform X2 n=1 Tax=Halyomorpha halys TaxID=286706 RepID=UPI0006D51987|nr:ABC transporter G family member 23-like isoform X2 [Halyomorpha halys]XP_024220072.1 ABC transporter G family member 23-like isoform X2 [Halyomorpha halys]
MLIKISNNELRGGEMTERREEFVAVRGAYKRYGLRAVVLNGFDMTVEKGTVYAFLGPSGCGKTTLLGCIVGRKRLDAGEIKLGVKYKSDIGYMPQEIALFKDFSISETLTHFAWVFGLSKHQLKKRKEELYGFLELPPETSLICELSGGQQRRISLCVALLHNPELLILDEPTVGVDPVLSHSIWQHLKQMSTVGNKTIIITTHSIEEARQADRVGLMRGGVLLAEGDPKSLMNQYGFDTLEEVFLQLSYKQEAGDDFDIDNQTVKDYPKPAQKPKPPVKQKCIFTMNHLIAHFLKNYFFLRRNLGILAFLLCLPIVQCTLFDLSIGRDPLGLKVGLVNDEISSERDCKVSSTNVTCSVEYPASCRYMAALEKKQMKLILFKDEKSARNAAKKNEIWGFMHVSHNYTESLFERIMLNAGASDEALENSEVDVSMDMSNQYIGNLLRRDMYFAYIDYLENLYADCNWPVQAARVPIAFQKAVYGNIYPTFSDFAVPAILQLFVFYLPMMFTVGGILMEKREGILERNLISGMTLVETLTGHAIVAMSILIIQTLFMMIVLFVIFDNTIEGSLMLALSLLFLVGLSGMCYGCLVSVLCDSDTAATYMGLGSFFPLAMLSGMFWPYQGMHYLLRSIGWFLPLTLTTEGFRAIASRSWNITHPIVYNGFLSVIGWIIFFCIITLIVVKIKRGIRNIM